MTDQADKPQTEPDVPAAEPNPLDELAELEQTIRRRLRRNQLFLERFMDEDFEEDEKDLDDPEPEDIQESD